MPENPNDESLLGLIKKYFSSDPLLAAQYLSALSSAEASGVLIKTEPNLCAEILKNLDSLFAARVCSEFNNEYLTQTIEHLTDPYLASLFFHMDSEQKHRTLSLLGPERKKSLSELLTYPKDCAARIVSTEFFAFNSEMTVAQVVDRLRDASRKGAPLSYVYVVNRQDKLLGVLNMRDMLLAQPDKKLIEIMRKEVFTIDAFMDREMIAQELSNRKFFSVPVVDREGKLLGVIKAENLLEGIQDEATEDFQKMFGAGADERAFSPISFSLGKRLPWLYVNLLTAFLAAGVIAVFEGLIAQITMLAIFLPIIAGQGGNAGAQSLAVVMRGIVMREIPEDKAKQLILKETWIGVVSGLSVGLVTGAIAWLWRSNAFLGVVVCLGMFVNLVFAGLSGAAIPLSMKKLGFDPAQCSNIILTTVTDVMGFFVFLGLALIFKAHLI